MIIRRRVEKVVAVASFVQACVLAILALLISDEHDIAAGVAMVVAQFLLLTASIFGIDYKFTSYGRDYTTSRGTQ